MSIKTFLENFELLTDAPNAVVKLREIILQLAARGKLVHQDSNDEPASVLLKRIFKQRKHLISQGKIKDEKALSSINYDELLHPIPSNWVWTRLGEVVNYSGARKVSPDEIPETSWLLDLEDIEKDTSRVISRKTFADKNSKSTKAEFKTGDVLYGKLRPYLNKVVVADSEGFCTTEIVPLQPYEGVISDYVKYVLKRPDFLAYVNSKTYGINLPRLGTEDGRRAIFPLPPTEEQKRIVAKVDRLLILCDEIEKRQQQRQESIKKMNESAVAQLLSSQNPDDFRQHWQRICNNFDLLYSIPETIPKLRQAILQLAVQGKLVRQYPNDEPASALLDNIRIKKALMVKDSRINNYEIFSPVDLNELLFELPNGWQWCRLGDLTTIRGGKRLPSGASLSRNPTSYIYIRVSDMQNGTIDDSDLHYLDKETYNKIKNYIIKKEDLYLTIVGSTIGKLGIVPEKFDGMNLTENAARIILYTVDKIWLKTFLDSQFIQNQFFDKTNQLGQPKLALKRIASVVIPLPPLAEQKRIVAKVDRLMSFCDELEGKLKEERFHSEKLMEVAAREVLAV